MADAVCNRKSRRKGLFVSKRDDWMDKVGGLPCVLCKHVGRGNVFGVELHHLFDASQRNDFLVARFASNATGGRTAFMDSAGKDPSAAGTRLGRLNCSA
jgi:hypothetical protein